MQATFIHNVLKHREANLCSESLIHSNRWGPDDLYGSIFLHKEELKFQINRVGRT